MKNHKNSQTDAKELSRESTRQTAASRQSDNMGSTSQRAGSRKSGSQLGHAERNVNDRGK